MTKCGNFIDKELMEFTWCQLVVEDGKMAMQQAIRITFVPFISILIHSRYVSGKVKTHRMRLLTGITGLSGMLVYAQRAMG